MADERRAELAEAGQQRDRPGGTPPAVSACMRRSAQPGDCSAGLRMTALPVASAR